MTFYCLCTAKAVIGNDLNGFRVDDYLVSELDLNIFTNYGVILLENAIECKKIGVRQFLAKYPNKNNLVNPGDIVYEHFPSVDIFQCKDCGFSFAR